MSARILGDLPNNNANPLFPKPPQNVVKALVDRFSLQVDQFFRKIKPHKVSGQLSEIDIIDL
jgi:hypothetical protein